MNSLFEFANAWNQTGLFLGGLFCFAIGLGFVGDWFYKRAKGSRYLATIVAVRERKSGNSHFYYPIVEYFSRQTGQMERAETNVGSNSLKGKAPGTKVRILVMPDTPHKASIDGKLTLIMGVFFLIPAVVLMWIAITKYEFSAWSIILPLGLVCFFLFKILGGSGMHLRRASKSKYAVQDSKSDGANPEHISSLKEVKDKILDSIDRNKTFNGEGEILDASAFAEKQKAHNKQVGKFSPFGIFLGLIFLCVGMWLTQNLLHLLNVGQRAPGVVVRLEEQYNSSSSGSSGYTYYPVVEFTVQETGRTVEFRESMGSNPPLYDQGDKVTVLYDPSDPSEEAMIDKGIWNWLVPGGCLILGGLVFLLSLKSFITSRRQLERV